MKNFTYIIVIFLITYLFTAAYIDNGRINSASAATAICNVYGVQDFGTRDTQVIRYNLSTKTVTEVGAEKTGYNMEAIDIHPITNVIYGIPREGPNAKKLVTIDGQTGAVTVIGDTGNEEIASLSFRKQDNTLWAWDKLGTLFTVNLGTGQLTQKYANTSQKDVEALAWNNQGTILYFTREEKASLFALAYPSFTITTVVPTLPGLVEGMDMLADGVIIMGVGAGTNSLEMFSYDPITKQKIDSLILGTKYYDLEGIAYPDNCDNPFHPPTPTPAATRTPSGSPRASATPVRTATPRPSASPGPNACAPDCSTKLIGTFDAFNNFTPATSVKINTEYWVRLEIENLSATTINVNEKINTEYFSIVNPTSTTFRIRIKSGGSVNCGSDLSLCILSKSSSSLVIKVPSVSEDVYVFFKVVPIKATAEGDKTEVDDPTSVVTYSNGHNDPLDNVEVGITGALPFYQTQNSGDVFSAGGYDVNLPDNATYLATGTYPGIVGYVNNVVKLGSQTKVSSKDWKYRSNVEAEEYTYGNLIQTVKNPTVLTTNRVTESGFYKVNGDFRVESSSFPSLAGKKIVIFVEGNLYINSGIRLPFDGNSSITFIVRKNIGVNTAVKDTINNEVRGIFITDGVIDTACNSSFSGDTCNPPGPITDTSTLNLQGIFVAHDGFNLDRKGDPTNAIPGEKFIYRPELLLAAGSQLGSVFYVWKEVTPDSN
jgi:hypothetical protein